MAGQRRSALVTGGGRGIGRAASFALARRGYDVVVNYRRNRDAAEKTATELRALGVRAHAIEADLADAAACERLFDEAHRALGAVDVLVNNAGVAPTTKLDDISLEEWAMVMDTNVRAYMLLARRALAGMREQGWGRVVNVASQAGISGGFFVGAHYAASKGAIIALTKSLAKLTAATKTITVNCVAPGLIDTDLVAAFPADEVTKLTGGIPMRRLGTADEVGAAIGFLASDEAAYITGAVLPVDGGLLAG